MAGNGPQIDHNRAPSYHVVSLIILIRNWHLLPPAICWRNLQASQMFKVVFSFSGTCILLVWPLVVDPNESWHVSQPVLFHLACCMPQLTASPKPLLSSVWSARVQLTAIPQRLLPSDWSDRVQLTASPQPILPSDWSARVQLTVSPKPILSSDWFARVQLTASPQPLLSSDWLA